MEKTLKLGIIGFGRIVELIHIPILQKLKSQMEIVGVYDVTESRLKLAEKRGYAIFSDLHAFFQLEMDAVVIATPPNSHFDIAMQAIERKKHVLIEKPVTCTYQEAFTLQTVADKHGVGVTVFHNHRFDPDFLFVQETIAKGTLGSLTFLQRNHHSNQTGSNFGVKSFDPSWRVQKAYGGGALLDWGVHLVDQLLHLQLGEIAYIDGKAISLPLAEGEVDDFVYVYLHMKNHMMASLNINFRTQLPQPAWMVGGTEGTMQIDGQTATIKTIDGEIETFSIAKPSRLSAKHIYESFLNFMIKGTPLHVPLSDAVEGMRILEHIQIQNEQANVSI
ncbi:Gfo/Idh/MocA family protein [Longirhabdus pacifica]|uniref:Gfo/Idh/MocA family protein n=1 Tax=Longirhabdus pacifica TaxID=2305227 RepID=UPI0013E8A83C|nr:Gfo/Idh/MocA family oxidoreductase [Longirhabdus pacifica]